MANCCNGFSGISQPVGFGVGALAGETVGVGIVLFVAVAVVVNLGSNSA
jgi:hypothetical protein